MDSMRQSFSRLAGKMKSPAGREPRTTTPLRAALASFLFPGLGQALAGKPFRGMVVAIPAITVLGALAFIAIFARHSVVDNATNDRWLASLLLLDLVGLIYHLWAMIDAYLLARGPSGSTPLPRKWMATAAIVVLVTGTLGVHAAIGAEVQTLRDTAYCLHSPIPCWMLNQSNATDNPNSTPLSEGGDVLIGDPSGSAAPTDTTPPATGSATVTTAAAPPGTLPDVQMTQNSKDWAKDGMLNVLLVGVDQAPGRSDFLTDTMILLQVDIATGRSAMYGIARNMFCLPMPKQIAVHFPNPPSKYACAPGTFTDPYEVNGEVNALWYSAAKAHPNSYPFYPRSACSSSDRACIATQDYMRGIMALEQGIGTLTGVTVDGTVLINLPGFARLVDDLGGIDINVPTTVSDYPCGPKGSPASKWRVCDVCGATCAMSRRSHNGYSVSDGSGAVVARMRVDAAKSGGKQTITYKQPGGPNIGFVIKAGQQHMSGEWALAYARTRIYTTDYDRMKRQQMVIQAIRNTVEPCTLLPKLLPPSSLLSDLGQAFWTDMPTDGATLTRLAGLAHDITANSVQRFSLDPGTLHSPSHSTMITAAGWATARSIVAHGLDAAPAATGTASGGGSSGGGSGC